MDPQTYLEALRAVVLLRAIWEGFNQDAIDALGLGAEVVQADYRPEAWVPSYIVARRGADVEIYVQGTSNGWQINPHVLGGGIGQREGFVGVVHSGFAFAGDYLERETRAQTEGAANVRIYGHSYGGAAAQVLAQRLVDRGRNPETVRVVSVGSPKVWNNFMGDPAYTAKIVMNTVDPVPLLPPEDTPVVTFQYFPVPGPTVQRGHQWAYRGEEIWLAWDGRWSDDWDTALGYERQPAGFLGADAHFFRSYREHLNRLREREGWPTTQDSRDLNELFFRIESRPPGASKTIPDSTWVEGMEPLNFLWGSGFSNSKGNEMALDGIWCKVHFRQGPSGWTESYLWRPAGVSAPTMGQASIATKKMLTNRVKFGYPGCRYNVHYYIDAISYRRDGGSREGWVEWKPEISDKSGDESGASRTDVEAPFMGMQIRVWSGDVASRLMILRPVPDTSFMNAAGQEYNHKTLRENAVAFGAYLAGEDGWMIKGRNRALPKNTITQVITASLAPGLVQLKIPAHGYALPNQIQITGGDKKHAPLRGTHRILAVNDSDTITIQTDKVVEQGYGGPEAQLVDYIYYKITSAFSIRLSKRDTGRPIKQGHGGQ